MWKTFQNNNFIVYQSSSIWNVLKLPLKTSKTFGFDISPVQFALPQVALNNELQSTFISLNTLKQTHQMSP